MRRIIIVRVAIALLLAIAPLITGCSMQRAEDASAGARRLLAEVRRDFPALYSSEMPDAAEAEEPIQFYSVPPSSTVPTFDNLRPYEALWIPIYSNGRWIGEYSIIRSSGGKYIIDSAGGDTTKVTLAGIEMLRDRFGASAKMKPVRLESAIWVAVRTDEEVVGVALSNYSHLTDWEIGREYPLEEFRSRF